MMTEAAVMRWPSAAHMQGRYQSQLDAADYFNSEVETWAKMLAAVMSDLCQEQGVAPRRLRGEGLFRGYSEQ